MIKEYLEYQRRVRQLSNDTIAEYRKDLEYFEKWMKVAGTNWEEVDRQQLIEYQLYLDEQNLAPATQNKKTSALRCIFRYMEHEGIRKDNPARYLQSAKLGKALPRTCNMQDVARYLTQACLSRRDYEMHALTALLVTTGLRLQEALNIRRADINKEKREITVKGKGNKERKVYYTEHTANIINAYARGRKDYIFETRDQREVRLAMQETLGQTIKGVHPHMLRHTYATEMLERGVDIKTLSAILGHESVKTTERYARVKNESVKRAQAIELF